MTNARYQVFVSSTYLDLVEERRQVSEQLQKLRCIPSGMELFTASGRPPWDLIQSAINDSDYVVLILAGRYGSSLGDDGRSYTEREYDYALSLGTPILPFLHQDLGTVQSHDVDTDPLVVAKRTAFWEKVRDSERHTAAFWRTCSDLAQLVLTGVTNAISDQPRPGWVRGTGEQDARQAKSPSEARQTSGLVNADDFRETLTTPGGAARVERAISDAEGRVNDLPFTKGKADYNAGSVQVVHAEWVTELEEAARPLVQAVSAAARWGNSELDTYWLELIGEMGRQLRLGGYAALIDLSRGPAVLALAAAGLGASAGRRDSLLGLLLSEQLEVDHPYRDERVPAVAVLSSSLIYVDDWASQRLHTYFKSILGEDAAWRGSVFDRAWERWEYLAAVAKGFYSTKLQTSSGVVPYLRIEDQSQRGVRPVVARMIRKDVASRGDTHSLLSNGFCDGSAELFDAAAEKFDNRYGEWGNNEDWAALPDGGGAMPSGLRYPGERGNLPS